MMATRYRYEIRKLRYRSRFLQIGIADDGRGRARARAEPICKFRVHREQHAGGGRTPWTDAMDVRVRAFAVRGMTHRFVVGVITDDRYSGTPVARKSGVKGRGHKDRLSVTEHRKIPRQN